MVRGKSRLFTRKASSTHRLLSTHSILLECTVTRNRWSSLTNGQNTKILLICYLYAFVILNRYFDLFPTKSALISWGLPLILHFRSPLRFCVSLIRQLRCQLIPEKKRVLRSMLHFAPSLYKVFRKIILRSHPVLFLI